MLSSLFFRHHYCSSAKYKGKNDGDVPCIFYSVQSFIPPHKLSMVDDSKLKSLSYYKLI